MPRWIDITDSAVPGSRESLARRRAMPTRLSAAEIRRINAAVRRRSLWSARMESARYLETIREVVDALLQGRINHGTARMLLGDVLEEIGILPRDNRDITDPASRRRRELILETQERKALNYGRMVAGNQPDALYEFPAWELIRLLDRRVPRGTPDSGTVAWQRRWSDAANAVNWQGVADPAAAGGRMVARKDSPVWAELGAGTGGYDDSLGDPFPPFAYNSGMGWGDVDRPAAIALGLVDPNETPAATLDDTGLAPRENEVRQAYERMSPETRRALWGEIGESEDDFLRNYERDLMRREIEAGNLPYRGGLAA